MLRINNIKMPINHNDDDLKKAVENMLDINKKEFKSFEITGQAIDARNKNNIIYVYSVDIALINEDKYKDLHNVRKMEKSEYIVEKVELKNRKRPVIVGSGPSGLFAALILAEAGLKPIIIEQRKDKKMFIIFLKTENSINTPMFSLERVEREPFQTVS